MFKLFKYLKAREWTLIALCAVAVVFSVWLDLTLPDYMRQITAEISKNNNLLLYPNGADINEVYRFGWLMLACAVGSLAVTILVAYISSSIGSGFSKSLRSAMYEKVDEFSLAEINKFSTPSLITRSTNDIMQVQMAVTMSLQIAIKAPVLAVWAMIKISDANIEWTMAVGVGVIIMIALFVTILALSMPRFRKMQVLTDNINRVARENLTGLSIVRAYNAEHYQSDKFEKANDDLTKTQLFTSRAMSFVMPTIATLNSGLALAIYWVGAYLIDNIGPGPEAVDLFSNMVIFSSYAMQIIFSVMMATMWFVILPRSQVAAKRINEVLDTPISVMSGNKKDGQEGLRGVVEFKDVSFGYNNAAEPVLSGINFTAKQGETVAFIGGTGSGKTTLVNMVPRLYDASSGEVLIDGINIKEYDLPSLYDKMGYISQKSVMFDGTIRSNIAFGDVGNKMSEDDIYRGLEIAQGKDFVDKLEKGLESSVARGGTNFSGGQKQRLSIARAIAKRPEFLIFDDSFSALDYKTDKALRGAIKKHTSDTTVLVVAQRIGTIMDADQIIVLDEGKIVGKGKHRDLLETCPVYLDIAKSQLSEEELAR